MTDTVELGFVNDYAAGIQGRRPHLVPPLRPDQDGENAAGIDERDRTRPKRSRAAAAASTAKSTPSTQPIAALWWWSSSVPAPSRPPMTRLATQEEEMGTFACGARFERCRRPRGKH